MAEQNNTPKTDCNDISTKEIKETFVSKYGRLFLLVLTVFTFIFICLLYFVNKEFRSSQNNIISCYEQHIKQADSLYYDMVNYNKDYVFNINELSTKVVTDSLIKASLNSKKGISKEQYNNLSKIITSYFDDMRQLHEQYDRKTRHDSLLICAEEQLLKGQTNKLLELHLNKVEHEYSNITIWAAVLTIIFLVFSFYSIFKMDELVQQGNDGVREIKSLRREGEKTIDIISQKGARLLKINRTNINNQQQLIVKTTESVLQRAEDTSNRIDESIKKAYTSLEELNKIRDKSTEMFKNELDKIDTDYNLKINEKVLLLDMYIEKIKVFMEEKGIQYQNNEEGDKNE